MAAPDKGIPQDLLNKAHCVVIVPGLKKAAFIFGARYGKGYVTCRQESGVGWSAPATVRVEGGSFGLQLGATETDVIMLVTTRQKATMIPAKVSRKISVLSRTVQEEVNRQSHAKKETNSPAEIGQAYRRHSFTIPR
jgi:lipid-binding SYLF domain-containing protein